MFRSSVSTGGATIDGMSDYVYYNADIINNRSSDVGSSTGLVLPDPQIRFNETRDTALIRDASQYHFSIIRFTMDGAGLDLPLFIPAIKLGQADPNLTTYQVGISYQQSWTIAAGNTITFNLVSDSTPLIFVPENLNQVVAPPPAPPLTTQDISTRYYYVSSYNSVVAMLNTAINTAYLDLYTKFVAAWGVQAAGVPFPFSGYNTGPTPWIAAVQAPTVSYNPSTKLFTILADSDGFGTGIQPGQTVPNGPVLPFFPATWVGPDAVPATFPTMRLFFNTNLYGLFNNFQNTYWNSLVIPGLTTVPPGYTYEILFQTQNYENLIDYRQPPYSAPASGPSLVPTSEQKVYYNISQEYASNSQLWSPISALVFTSSLLPIKYENTGVPNVLGTDNLGVGGTSASAFQPIITDIALDTSTTGADSYRQFIYYAPSAEYRLTDFGKSKADIRQIDIQVFWKNRLDNQLIPLTMYNLSTVSIKVMFRHKRAASGDMDK